MPAEQPTPDRAAEARIDWFILCLLLDDEAQRPWATAEVVREHGHEPNALDGLDRLHGTGLIHRTHDGFVFASRAAIRYSEIAE
jgi:hypothetical protein